MRHFKDGDVIYLEPWRAKAFPVIKDLAVNRASFDRIIAAPAAFISVPTGSAPDGNAIPIRKQDADLAMDAAACIGCGACVAACPTRPRLSSSAPRSPTLATCRKERSSADRRALAMVQQMNIEGFANCTNIGECEAACPKDIKLEVIARTNRDYIKAAFTERPDSTSAGAG